ERKQGGQRQDQAVFDDPLTSDERRDRAQDAPSPVGPAVAISARRWSEALASPSSATIPVLAARCWISRHVDSGSATMAASRAAAALARRTPQGRDEAEVVEDHRPDVEDEGLRCLEGLLNHLDEEAQLAAGILRIAAEQAIHDLGLEGDVRQALGRAVVHRPGDLAAEILLGVEDDPRHRAATVGAASGREERRAAADRLDPAVDPGELGEHLAEPRQGLVLALEDVD